MSQWPCVPLQVCQRGEDPFTLKGMPCRDVCRYQYRHTVTERGRRARAGPASRSSLADVCGFTRCRYALDQGLTTHHTIKALVPFSVSQLNSSNFQSGDEASSTDNGARCDAYHAGAPQRCQWQHECSIHGDYNYEHEYCVVSLVNSSGVNDLASKTAFSVRIRSHSARSSSARFCRNSRSSVIAAPCATQRANLH